MRRNPTQPQGSIVKVKPKFQVTIPHSVREHIRIGVGDLVEIEARDNLILIKPQVLKDRASRAEVDAAIAESIKDIAEGRVSGPFETHKDLMRHLYKTSGRYEAKNNSSL